MLMLFVLSCKIWNVGKPGALLARLPSGAQQSQRSFLIFSMETLGLHSQQVVTYSQGSVQAG